MGVSISARPVSGSGDRRAFIDLPKRLYRGVGQWVAMFDLDYRNYLRRRHPYFRHTDAEFFVARRGGEVVGRIAAFNNTSYNRQHATNAAHFFFADFADDVSVSDALFGAVADWARARGLTSMMGPLFMGGTYGGGVLVEGFEFPAAMTMMPYNAAYYPTHFESAGFQKAFDVVSLGLSPTTFRLPERIARIADLVRKRGHLRVLDLRSARDLRRAAASVAELYNPTIADHEENYPLSDEELKAVTKDLLLIARPELEKVIEHDGTAVGYMLSFPDLTPILQRMGGRVGPAGILALMRGHRQARRIIVNGMGIAERYRKLGGNALLYDELVRTISDPRFHFDDAEMVQVHERNALMLRDLTTLGARLRKRHRVYRRGTEV